MHEIHKMTMITVNLYTLLYQFHFCHEKQQIKPYTAMS